MKKTRQVRKIRTAKNTGNLQLWNLHQHIGRFAQRLSKANDLAEISSDRQGTAPISLLALLF